MRIKRLKSYHLNQLNHVIYLMWFDFFLVTINLGKIRISRFQVLTRIFLTIYTMTFSGVFFCFYDSTEGNLRRITLIGICYEFKSSIKVSIYEIWITVITKVGINLVWRICFEVIFFIFTFSLWFSDSLCLLSPY